MAGQVVDGWTRDGWQWAMSDNGQCVAMDSWLEINKEEEIIILDTQHLSKDPLG